MLGKITKQSSKILEREHKNILKVADALTKECDLIGQGKTIDEKFFRDTIDFIKNYADKFHHAKEEDILFKEFNKYIKEDSGCVHCNPVEQMLIEHSEGRKFVKGMEESLNNKNKKELINNAIGYSSLIQEHIFKEDNILYPMADSVLSEKIEKEMLEKFKEVEKENKDKEKEMLEFVGALKK